MAFAGRPRAPLLPWRLSGRLRAWRGLCALAMARPRCFALELRDCTLAHFALGAEGADARPDPRLAELLGPPGRSYSLCVPAAADGDCGARVQAARVHQNLQRQLRSDPFQRCQLHRLLCYCPGSQAQGVQHGFLLRDPCDCLDTRRALLELLGRVQEAERPHLGEFEADSQGVLWQRVWVLQESGQLQVGCARVLPTLEPPLHPVVPHLLSSAVFPDLDTARAILETCMSSIPEAQAVLDVIDKCPRQVQRGKFPVIAIEGLDATGKTTVTQAVSRSLQAVLLYSPPSCIGQWRKTFDDEPTIIKRAFYSLGNYIVASEIAKASAKSPVIVDRFWHSTATYGIATELSGGLQHLPPAHHPVYQWPGDLLKPDLVLLLTMSPEERAQRLRDRGLEQTREEAELEANSVFRQKVEVSYRRMENPGCLEVDASPSREKVLQTVLGLIRNTFQDL
ncbi:UMP-CMP kinase 2, mitochondrial [Callospermophilus lateralis]|uniref:UMP-CMP kinase 2, mitochondrial n=1 Tax=Callospermophilus lateralis TaxID=76772 RepID=UPI004038BCA0